MSDPDSPRSERDPGSETPATREPQEGPPEGEGDGRDEMSSSSASEARTAPEVSGAPYALVWRVVRGVDYLFYLLYALLVIRFALALLGAREGAGFVQLVHGVTAPFYAPFRGIVARPDLNGGYLDLPLVLALLAYVLLHLAIHGLIRLIIGPRYAEPRP